jgi:hypothetical protein
MSSITPSQTIIPKAVAGAVNQKNSSIEVDADYLIIALQGVPVGGA